MHPAVGILLCLAYILGLLSTAIPWGGYGCLALGIGAAVLLPRGWRSGPRWQVWFIAGVLGLVASGYLQLRTPQPEASDISQFIPQAEISNRSPTLTVKGVVDTLPRLTRSQRAQLWLQATQVEAGESQSPDRSVTGRLYVTVPLLQATGVVPGQEITVTGSLYQPQASDSRCAFNFKQYLAQEGAFAGLSGRTLELLGEKPNRWGWWSLRRRIVQSQVRFLGVPEGTLVSAMVLGGRAVDLPFDVRDRFVRVGLAHALAASGFQVSLILGVVLALTQRFAVKTQAGSGAIAILLFVGLAGASASVLRAAVMGFAGLAGLLTDRKVKPVNALVVAATLLLLFNPWWIWDLGFQLSFAATLGLLVTVPALTTMLTWLPPVIATAIAVPIAATIWTLPIQIFAFCLVSPYCILANLVTVPLITVISLGGFASGILGLIYPLAGSIASWLLYYPTHYLIGAVNFFSLLPGNSLAVGTISIVQFWMFYGLIGLVWCNAWWQKHWWLSVGLALGLVAIPVVSTQLTLQRVTVLATPEPIVVIQDRGRVTLINSGNPNTATFNLLPFLQQQAINAIDAAIATESQTPSRQGWLKILERLPVKTFYDYPALKPDFNHNMILNALRTKGSTYQPLSSGRSAQIGAVGIELIQSESALWQLQIFNHRWLLVDNPSPAQQRQLSRQQQIPRADLLLWSGAPLTAEFVAAVQPQWAIAATANEVDPDIMELLRKHRIDLHWTKRDGEVTVNGAGEIFSVFSGEAPTSGL